MPATMQRSFAGGEVSDVIYSRSDIVKHAIAVALAQNAFAHVHGPMSNRPGFEFAPGYARYDTENLISRLVPFVFNNVQTYMLEFGSNYMRVIKDGGHVLEASHEITAATRAIPVVVECSNNDFGENDEIVIQGVEGMVELNGRRWKRGLQTVDAAAITGITAASPGVVTCAAGHTFLNDHVVYITGVVGMTELNGQLFKCSAVGATTFTLNRVDGTPVDTSAYTAYVSGGTATRKAFELLDRDGQPVDSLGLGGVGFGTYTSGGTASKIFQIETPYAEEDIRDLVFTQSADRIRIAHNNYWPRVLTRLDHDDWTLEKESFRPSIGAPQSLTAEMSYHYFSAYAVAITNPLTAVDISVVPCTVSITHTAVAASQYSVGARISLSNLVGAEELNDRHYIVGSYAAGVIELNDEAGNDVDARGYAVYVSGGQAGQLLHEYAVTAIDAVSGEEGLPALAAVAGADLGQKGTSATTTTPAEEFDVVLSWDPPASGSVEHYNIYKRDNGMYGYIGTTTRTYFRDNNIQPELGDNPPASPVRDPINKAIEDSRAAYIAGITEANPAVVTAYRHGFVTNQVAFIEDAGGMVEVNDRYFKITVIDGDTFSLDGVDSSGYTTFTLGGTATVKGVSLTNPVSIRAPKHGYAEGHRVNLNSIVGTTELNDIFFTIAGDVTGDTFEIDLDATLFTAYVSGGYASDFPAVVGRFQQRVGYAARYNDRQAVDWTMSGIPNSFQRSSIGRGDDAFGISFASDKVNEIRHILPDTNVLIFTDSGVWISRGDGAYTAQTVSVEEQSSVGCSKVRPLRMPRSILFVQEGTLSIQDIAYSFEADKMVPSDRTLLAPHLIEDRDVVSWAYAEKPYQIVYAAMDDGTLLSMTYNLEHDVWAWSQHETDGFVEDVASVREGDEDSVYIVVRRTIDGIKRRMIERMHTRKMNSVRDAFFVDSGLTYDAPVPIQEIVERETGLLEVVAPGHGLAENDVLEIDGTEGSTELNTLKFRAAQVLPDSFYLVGRYPDEAMSIENITVATPPVVTTVNPHGLSNADVVYIDEVDGMTEVNDKWFIARGVTADTFLLFPLNGEDPLDGSAFTPYVEYGRVHRGRRIETSETAAHVGGTGAVRKAVSEVSGLWHLAGKTVAVLNDGSVEVQKAVSEFGKITLDNPGARVHAGLPYTSTVKLLPIEDPDGNFAGRDVTVTDCVVNVRESAGMWVGQTADKMNEVFHRDEEGWDAPVSLQTGVRKVPLEPSKTMDGTVIIEQRDPLPLTLLSVKRIFKVGNQEW